jgi:hypothetical protein
MAPSTYWADKYIENKRSAREALSQIRPELSILLILNLTSWLNCR